MTQTAPLPTTTPGLARKLAWIDALTPDPNHEPNQTCRDELDNARLVIALEQEQRERLEDEEYRRGSIAMRLAPDLETYQALMRGEKVHPDRLDQRAVRHYRARGLWNS